ncbi:MAG: DUF5320 domain-containing protein [Candidatus Omnitrophica bacterium]|nr:DUF5320 domain-containing protein [Candidatus Omnitrophota bacterium]
MPGGNGTGPMGTGPMTGRQAGFCAGYSVPGYGRGGRGAGFGRGAGWKRNGAPYAYGNPNMTHPTSADPTPKQEADMLKTEAEALKEELSAINRRIKDLGSV